MVQVTQGLPNVAKEMNNFMFGQLGKGLGQAMSHYSAQGALQGVLGSPEYKKAQVPDKIQMLNEKMSRYGEPGKNMLATQLGIEQKVLQEKQQKSLASIYDDFLNNRTPNPKDIEIQEPEIQMKIADRINSKRVASQIGASLRAAGAPEDVIAIHENAIAASEKGTGQTYAIKSAIDDMNRFKTGGMKGEQTGEQGSGQFSKLNPNFEFPKPQIPEFQTLKEYNDFRQSNVKSNLDAFNENLKSKKLANENQRNFSLLRQYNDKIPTGFAKWDVNPSTGELFVPAGAPMEAQEYVKIINQMLNGAKDVFGARITNFDAQTYLQSLPNLSMSPEGRELITRHMQIANDMNKAYYDALDEVYKRYPKGEITAIEASKMADEIAGNKITQLEQEWHDVYNQMQRKQQGLQEDEVSVLWQGKIYGVPQDELQSWLDAGGKAQ